MEYKALQKVMKSVCMEKRSGKEKVFGELILSGVFYRIRFTLELQLMERRNKCFAKIFLFA